METTTLICTACGAPIYIAEDASSGICSFCGVMIKVDRGADYVTTKASELIADSIEEAGEDAEETIRENSELTRDALNILQIRQDYNYARLKLDHIQTEIRALERDPNQAIASKQMLILKTNELQTIEKIRELELSYEQPNLNDISSLIQIAEKRRNIINMELSGLEQKGYLESQTSKRELLKRKDELTEQITQLKMNLLIEDLPSFHIKEHSARNREAIQHHLKLLSTDEETILDYHDAPEVELVYKEIIRRKQELSRVWNTLEEQRLRDTLKSLDYHPINNRDSYEEYLELIKHDIAFLLNSANSDPQIKLLDQFENEKEHIENLLQKSEKPSKTIKFPPDIPTIPPRSRRMSEPFIGEKSVIKGVAYALIILLGFVFGGLLIAVVIFGALNIDGEKFPVVGTYMLFLSVGFFLSARSFLLNAVPDLEFRNLLILPDITINSRKSGRGIANLFIVRLLVGGIVSLQIFLLFTSFGFAFFKINIIFGTLLIILGMLLGPFAGIWAFFKTSFSSNE